MKRSTGLGPIPVLLAAGLLLSSASLAKSARAGTELSGDIDFAAPINSMADAGVGFGARLGYRAHLPPLLVLTPELAFTYYNFSGAYAPVLYRGTAGLRLGIGEILRPGVFTHLGVGRLDVEGKTFDVSHTGFTYDVGVFLDFTLLPFVNLGVHGAYNHMDGSVDGGLGWATLGAQASFVF